MNPTGTRLARVQVAGQAGIDRVYADLADAVEAEVWRWSTRDADGGDALPMSARAAILAAVALLLDRTRPALITAVLAARTAARGAALAGQSPLPVDVAEEAAARIEVARTIGGAQPGVLRQLGAVLATGIGAGLAAGEIAKRARQYFAPWFAPRRNVAGQVTRAGRQGAIATWPGRAGYASQHVRLVMLYQSAESHDAAIRGTAERAGAAMRWNLSAAHAGVDVCDGHARLDSGLGPGVYWPRDYPPRPHPGCRCYASLAAVPVSALAGRTP